MIALERLAAAGWQGTRSERLGNWLLRAGSGFTGRANSALPLGSPGCAVRDALAEVAGFYRRHDLPPQFQIPVGPETLILEAGSERRGWEASADWLPGYRAAVVRGALTGSWLGVTALTVTQGRRRTGVGKHLMSELLRWAADRGARHVYLQVAAENVGALGLYDRMGFTRHHEYHYRRPAVGSLT